MIEGHLYTEGIVKDSYLDEMKAQIAALPFDAEIIIHHIKSPGGSVYAAWKTIPELLKIGKPIRSLIEGEASSIASWIAVAPAFEVEATDPSTAMIHEPFFPDGINGALSVDDLDTARVELDQIRQSMAQAYSKKSGKPVDYWLAVMKKNTRMNAQMMKAEGLVDKITLTEPRRIAAEVMEVLKTDLNKFKTELMNIFGKRAIASAPIAVDLPLKDGKMLNVQSDNGDLVGKPATVDARPAEGVYLLSDGRTITCVGGIISAVNDVAALPVVPPQETEAQRLQKELATTQAKLNALTAAEAVKAKAAEEAAKIAAETAKQADLVKAVEDAKKLLAEQAAKIEALEARPAGNQNSPTQGMITNPVALGGQHQDKMMTYATRTTIADSIPWIEQTEQFQKKYPGGRYPDGTKFRDYRTDGGPSAVSILETNLGYTWNGVLSTDIFFKPTLSTPALADVFTVDLGAAESKRYHIAPVLNKILKPYTGCGQAVTGTSADITSKRIQLKFFEMYEKWCKDDFTDSLTGSYNQLAQDWLKTGVDSFDPAGTPVDRMIMKLLKDGIRRDIWRRVSFGDTTSSSADWNQIDGLWQSLIDQSGASNYCVYASKTNFGIGTLAASAAYNELVAIFKGSSNLLKEYAIDGGRGQFLCTRSVWENLYDSYAAVGAVTELAYQAATQGLGKLTFRGIPVVPITIWDDFLSDATNPLAATTRHLIAFTVKENHILGVENTADLDKIDSWFEKKDNARYYRSNMTMGFLGALHCDLTTISY